ncbi:hypothetical protein ACS0TY_010428 [Phlomoides rotata]
MSRWYLRCCDFLFSASLEHAHTCWVDPDSNAPHSLSSKGISIWYNQAVRSRQCANDCIYGDSEQSFNFLLSYLHQLKVVNPHSHVRLHTDHEHMFKYVLCALCVSINGFINCGRSVVVVDGTHLKGNNSRLQPQSFSTCDGYRLREAYGCPIDLLIVSNQHKIIFHVMSTVYPDATHGLCYYHLQKKIDVYKVLSSSLFVLFFFNTSIYFGSLFNVRVMDIIKRVDSDRILETLMNAKPKRWSRVQYLVKRYEFITSNAA